MKNGNGKHITILHLYTNYTITNKDIKDMTPLQYQTIKIIAQEINKWKGNNKPMVVI